MPEHSPKRELLRLEHEPVATAPVEPHPVFLHELAGRSEEFRHLLAHFLLPSDLLVSFGIDPVTWRNVEGRVMVQTATAEDGHIWGLRLENDIDPRDPLLEIEMTDTIFSRLSVTWVGINDPRAPRFDIDRTPAGGLTLRGAASRNLEAETAALLAGLAPGQVRSGLDSLRRLLADLEKLMAVLQHYEYEVEPLFYHNAILFERCGFHYVKGRELMRRIHAGFLPDGDLQHHLDRSTLFRDPVSAGSIRGRSWAVHDGILGAPWDDVKMIKRIGVDAGENTAPGIPW